MCGRKRRNTGSTARISALDAPMALNWLAAAQVALLLILTDNSAALCSYSATILLACRHRRKDAKARAGDDVLVKLAIDAPENIVRKFVKYV